MACEKNYVRMYKTCKKCNGVDDHGQLLEGAIGGVLVINGISFLVFVVLFMVARDADKNSNILDDLDNDSPTKKRNLTKPVTTRAQDAMGRFAGDQIMVARLSSGTVAGDGGITKSDLGLLLDRVKVVYGWMQIFSAMTITYEDVPWPEGFERFSVSLGHAVNLDLMGLLDATSCKFALPFLDKFILHMLVPIFVTFFVCLARVPAYFLRKTKDRRMAQTELMYKVIVTLGLIMYPGLCTRIFQVFKCTNFDGHPVQILQADYSIECFGDSHSPKIVLACVFMVIYVIGVPISVWTLLWLHKKHLYDPSQPKHQKVRREFGTLFEQYEPKFWYYECFVLVKKMLLTGAMMVVAPGSTAQLLIAILIVLFFMLCVFKLAPFEDAVDDWMSFLTSLQLMLTLLIGFAMMEDQSGGEYNRETMDALLIVINSAAFVALFVSIVLLHPKLRRYFSDQQESTSEQIETNPATSTKVRPSASQTNGATENGTGTSPAEDRAWTSY
jgi:hypothetical protein